MRVTGKPAAVILLLVAGVFLWRLTITHEEVPAEVREALREVLAAEYGAMLLPAIQAAVDADQRKQIDMQINQLKKSMETIHFPSMKARGGGRHYYVRAEIQVAGGPPPKGKPVRYFRFSHSRLLGYVYQEEVWAWSYYLPFMD